MFCKMCGTQFPDGQAFCPECGTQVESVAPVKEVQETVNNAVTDAQNAAGDAYYAADNAANGAYDAVGGAYDAANGAYNAADAYSNASGSYDAGAAGDYYNAGAPKTPMSAKTKKLIKWICAGVGAVALLIILILVLSSSPKKAVKKYFKSLEKGNAKKTVLSMMNKKAAETYIDKTYGLEPKEYYDYMDDASKVLLKGLKEEKYKLKLDLEIKDVEKLNKLDKLKSEVRDTYGYKELDDFYDDRNLSKTLDKNYGIDIDDIKNVAAVKFRLKMTAGKEKLETLTGIMLTYKYKGKWYILPTTSGLMPDKFYSLLQSDFQESLDKGDYNDLKKGVFKDYSEELKDFEKAVSKSKKSSKKYDDDDDYDDYDDYYDY